MDTKEPVFFCKDTLFFLFSIFGPAVLFANMSQVQLYTHATPSEMCCLKINSVLTLFFLIQ